VADPWHANLHDLGKALRLKALAWLKDMGRLKERFFTSGATPPSRLFRKLRPVQFRIGAAPGQEFPVAAPVSAMAHGPQGLFSEA
jgi:hypothetical protein